MAETQHLHQQAAASNAEVGFPYKVACSHATKCSSSSLLQTQICNCIVPTRLRFISTWQHVERGEPQPFPHCSVCQACVSVLTHLSANSNSTDWLSSWGLSLIQPCQDKCVKGAIRSILFESQHTFTVQIICIWPRIILLSHPSAY